MAPAQDDRPAGLKLPLYEAQQASARCRARRRPHAEAQFRNEAGQLGERQAMQVVRPSVIPHDSFRAGGVMRQRHRIGQLAQ